MTTGLVGKCLVGICLGGKLPWASILVGNCLVGSCPVGKCHTPPLGRGEWEEVGEEERGQLKRQAEDSKSRKEGGGGDQTEHNVRRVKSGNVRRYDDLGVSPFSSPGKTLPSRNRSRQVFHPSSLLSPLPYL